MDIKKLLWISNLVLLIMPMGCGGSGNTGNNNGGGESALQESVQDKLIGTWRVVSMSVGGNTINCPGKIRSSGEWWDKGIIGQHRGETQCMDEQIISFYSGGQFRVSAKLPDGTVETQVKAWSYDGFYDGSLAFWKFEDNRLRFSEEPDGAGIHWYGLESGELFFENNNRIRVESLSGLTTVLERVS